MIRNPEQRRNRKRNSLIPSSNSYKYLLLTYLLTLNYYYYYLLFYCSTVLGGVSYDGLSARGPLAPPYPSLSIGVSPPKIVEQRNSRRNSLPHRDLRAKKLFRREIRDPFVQNGSAIRSSN